MNFTQLYVHLVWATWERQPLVTEDLEGPVYAAILQKCRDLKCDPMAIGGMPDHLHLLVRLHPTVAVASLVGNVKGVASHLVTHELNPESFFKWQNGYGAFTLRRGDLPDLIGYIQNQKEHHARASLIPVLEQTAPH